MIGLSHNCWSASSRCVLLMAQRIAIPCVRPYLTVGLLTVLLMKMRIWSSLLLVSCTCEPMMRSSVTTCVAVLPAGTFNSKR